MKSIFYTTIFIFFAQFAIAQNIAIDRRTPFAAAKNTSIEVSFNPPANQPGPYTVDLVVLETFGSIFGGTPFTQSIVRSSATTATTTANITIGDIPHTGTFYNNTGTNFINYVYYIRAYSGTPGPVSPFPSSNSYSINIKSTLEPILGLRHKNSTFYPSGATVQLELLNGNLNPDNTFTATLTNQYNSSFSENMPVTNQPAARLNLQANAINNLSVTLPANIPDDEGYRIEIRSTSPNDLDIVGVTIDNSIPLPVRLVSFTAKSQKTGNLLQWQTAAEKNFSHFEIERSSPQAPKGGTVPESFEKIGEVKGNKGENCEFIDNSAFRISNSPLVYYRLKQVDLDGSYDYSKVIAVKNEWRENIQVYPNPAQDYVYVKNSNAEGININILNANGQLVLMQNNQKASETKVDISQVPKGLYYLQIADKNKVSYKKIIKE